MKGEKTRITDRLNNDQILQVIENAESRMRRYSGDLLARRKDLIQDARSAMMTWERNQFRSPSSSQDLLERALQELIQLDEQGGR